MARANYECKDTTKFADVQILSRKSLSFKVTETRIAFGRIDIEHAAYSTRVEEIEEYLLGGKSPRTRQVAGILEILADGKTPQKSRFFGDPGTARLDRWRGALLGVTPRGKTKSK